MMLRYISLYPHHIPIQSPFLVGLSDFFTIFQWISPTIDQYPGFHSPFETPEASIPDWARSASEDPTLPQSAQQARDTASPFALAKNWLATAQILNGKDSAT